MAGKVSQRDVGRVSRCEQEEEEPNKKKKKKSLDEAQKELQKQRLFSPNLFQKSFSFVSFIYKFYLPILHLAFNSTSIDTGICFC